MRSKRMRFQRKESRNHQSHTRHLNRELEAAMSFESGLDTCDRCGGDGMIELHDAPELWGEDCCSEANRVITCPDCKGDGVLT